MSLIIYDLDNTLFDTYGQIGRRVIGKMIKAMKEAGLTKSQERELREMYFYTGFRIIARRLGLNAKVRKLGLETYKEADFSAIKPYKDVRLIPKLSKRAVLVSSGIEQVQMRKIRALKIDHLFDKIIIDESSSLEGKTAIFRMIARKYKMKPSEVMVVGDNPESEIASAQKLGMIAVQILRRKGMEKARCPHRIKSLSELPAILKIYK